MSIKTSKSWKLTIAAIAIPIIMVLLTTAGITDISESQIESFIYLALGISAIGAGNKVGRTLVTEKLTPSIKSPNVRIIEKIIIPKLGPKGSKFQTNFVQSNIGNALPFGKNLWVQIQGVKSYVSAILKDAQGNVIQIDQSHQLDEDNNIETTRLEMFGKDGNSLPRGKYSITFIGDSGSSDSIGQSDDEFSII